jgi:hypothetical protein
MHVALQSLALLTVREVMLWITDSCLIDVFDYFCLSPQTNASTEHITAAASSVQFALPSAPINTSH